MRLTVLSIVLLLFTFYSCQDESSLIGDQYFEAGKYKEAIVAYNEYLKLKPRHVKTIYNRGRCYQELGQYEKAMDDFNMVIKLDRNNKNAMLSIGQEMYRREDFKSAIFYCDQVNAKDPNNSMAYYLMGRSNHRLGNTRTALNNYNTAINISKDFGEAYLYRGALKLFLKRKKEACSDLRKAVSLNTSGAKEALNKNCK